MTITSDTLAYSRMLQAAGMSQEQADAQARAMSEMVAAKELPPGATLWKWNIDSSNG